MAIALIDYARVSTESQHVDLQKDALRKVGYERVSEDIISGVKKERQGLDATLVYSHEDDTLVVRKLDRLGRSMVHLVNIAQGLAACGVDFKVLTGQGAVIDAAMAPDRLVLGIFVAFTEFECDLTRERTKAGLAAAAARGRKDGCKLVIIADKLQRARERIANGLNVRGVATRLRVSKTALYAALQSGNEQR